MKRRSLGKPAKLLLSVVLAAALLAAALPLVTGAHWAAIGSALGSLDAREVILLALIWFLGLYAYSFVLTAAMPPLTHRRAITLNLTGSAISNLFPAGGALGMSLNYAMTRSWGFSRPAFALYTFITNLWNLLTKLTLPGVALTALLLTGGVDRPELVQVAVVAVALLVAVVVLVSAALWYEPVARAIGGALDRVVNAVLRTVGSHRRFHVLDEVLDMRAQGRSLVRRCWAQLSLGMVAYSGLQALLLWTCLHMLGTSLSTPEIFAGYAVERVLTIVVITPGGTGLVEVGVTALLIAFGGNPVATVASVLIYRAFTFGLEIPVGGLGVLYWLWRRRSQPPAGATI